MNRIRHCVTIAVAIALSVCCLRSPAEAARSSTATQLTVPAEFAVGSSATLTFRIANTSTAGESMNRVRFYVAGAYSYFPSQTVTPPPGFTSCTLGNTTSVGGVTYYRRITCNGALAAGSNQSFGFRIINLGTSTSTDRTDQLSSVRARFSGSNTYYTPSNAGWQGGWTWKSLLMTLVPSSTTVGVGCQFTLAMTVTNRTNAAINTIAAVVNPPSASYTGGATVSTSSNPGSLNLNAGATGTLVWTYTMSGSPPGSASFSACASASGTCTTTTGSSKTSSAVASVPVNIASGITCGFTTAIVSTPSCLYSGGTSTFVMTVTNTTGSAVSTVTPTVLSVVTGAAQIGAFSGPVPATIASLPTNSSGTFSWTAIVTGNVNDTYAVTGNASANGGAITSSSATSPAQDIDGYLVTVSPSATNAESGNEELRWTVTNNACANINQVSISVPAGWTSANDAYAIVSTITGSQVDSWSPSGTTFTSPSSNDRIPPSPSSGDFFVLFSSTPSTAGTYTFNVTITDDASPTPVSKMIPTAVTVNAFGTGGMNATDSAIWHEDQR